MAYNHRMSLACDLTSADALVMIVHTDTRIEVSPQPG